MFHCAIRWFILLGTVIVAPVQARASSDVPMSETFCRDWFGAMARSRPLVLSETNTVVSEVTLGGQTYGWIFRTDQVPPVCKGKRGEIILAVALGADGRIKGLRVLSHHEDASYFKRLTAAFFQQFLNRRADTATDKIDAVTRATLSSKAIIRDVMSCNSSTVCLRVLCGLFINP